MRLTANFVSAIWCLARTVSKLRPAGAGEPGAAGTFVAINNVVSQSVAHLHVHVVPRRRKDGLRGFFWPRTKYEDDDEMAEDSAKDSDDGKEKPAAAQRSSRSPVL